ncbi:MAG: beta-ketoacyl-[acyl-carrier-protein] synthase family protein [Gammaproteobacteria bacterium]|nr:beta-ketoacyl-[acyl-carrier-protein] synthase family protein [Gammaproteobacteria bacterium]
MAGKVVVTGLGIISPLGLNTSGFWRSLVAGRSGVTRLPEQLPADLKVRIGAQVQEYQPLHFFSPNDISLLDRLSQFALIAAREAVADAGLSRDELRDGAVVIGTGCGGKETDERAYLMLYREHKRRLHPLTIPRGMPSAAASQVSMASGVTGPVFTVSSACASANHALIQALLLIRSGLVEVALAGGTDAPFTYGLLKAWEALRVLSPDGCRPFSNDRNGLVLGEGAGVIVLESEGHAKRRSASIYAELCGGGMSADAGHITDPSTAGAAAAISRALQDARLNPEEVDYLNAHGTGTLANDISETRAIRLAFGTRADGIALSSTKSMHGHALGAAGAFEMIATILAIKHGVAPATINFNEPGSGCDLDYIPNQSREMKIRAALSNSFAFGGLNAVVAVRAC